MIVKESKLKDRPLPTISPSSVADLDCAKKFYTLRVMGQWPKTNKRNFGALLYGTGVHEVLKQLYSPHREIRPDLDSLDVYAKAAFHGLRYPDQESRENDIDRCKYVVRNYVANDDIEDAEKTIAVERGGDICVERNGSPSFFLTNKLHRIILRGTTLVARDYKLGKPKIDLFEAFIQLWLAKLSFPGFREYVAEIDWINGDGRVERDVITTQKLQGVYPVLMAKINRVFDLMEAGEAPAEPCDLCTFCPLKPTCKPYAATDIASALDLVFDFETEEKTK